ncbi:MAG: DUF4114 domain-containing protein [Spirirestis rafaelensis WJT71-NPBG6]|nr:DUF4114 domain-containing protein [Spirirestis rafaelensis WJT71-NPBG6]
MNLTTTISDPSLPPAPVPLISITPLTGISLTEGGDSQTLAVGIDLGIDPILNTPIATLAEATITLTPDAQLDLGNGAGNPFNVIIPAGSTAATITNVAVRGVNDNVTEGNHTGTITATITSTNPILNALPGVNLTTNISDPLVTNPPATGGTGGTGTPGNPDIPGGTGGSGNGGTSSTPSAIAPLLIQNPNDFFTVQGPTGQQVILDFDFGSVNTSFIDEIGVYTVDDAQGTINGIAPGASGYLQAARNNAQPIFSVLPDINRLLPNADLLRNLSFEAGTNLGFYLVQNGTASDGANVFFGSPSANPNSTDYLEVSSSGDGNYTLGWRDQSGNQSFNNVVLSARATTQTSLPVGTQLQQTTGLELIDVLTQANQLVDLNFNIASEAAYNNSVGLYKVENAQGTIIDQLTGNQLNPGDANYAQVALRQSELNSELGSNRSASGLQQLDGGAIYAPYLIANGTRDRFLSSNPSNQTAQGRDGQVPLAYFAFQGANPDQVDHIRQLGNNTFGFEDTFGGGDRDFNDIVFKTNLTVRI